MNIGIPSELFGYKTPISEENLNWIVKVAIAILGTATIVAATYTFTATALVVGGITLLVSILAFRYLYIYIENPIPNYNPKLSNEENGVNALMRVFRKELRENEKDCSKWQEQEKKKRDEYEKQVIGIPSFVFEKKIFDTITTAEWQSLIDQLSYFESHSYVNDTLDDHTTWYFFEPLFQYRHILLEGRSEFWERLAKIPVSSKSIESLFEKISRSNRNLTETVMGIPKEFIEELPDDPIEIRKNERILEVMFTLDSLDLEQAKKQIENDI